jgi:hypothetical protein
MTKYPKDIIDGKKHSRYCKICLEFHDISEFYQLKDGNFTRYCRTQYRAERKDVQPFGLQDVENQNDKAEAERILTALGYELYNNDNPIHQQFERRIERKYKRF